MPARHSWSRGFFQGGRVVEQLCGGMQREDECTAAATLLLANLSPLLASSPAAAPQHRLVPEGDALAPGGWRARGLFRRRKVFS